MKNVSTENGILIVRLASATRRKSQIMALEIFDTLVERGFDVDVAVSAVNDSRPVDSGWLEDVFQRWQLGE